MNLNPLPSLIVSYPLNSKKIAKQKLLLCLSIFLSFLSFAQSASFKWAKSLGGTAQDYANSSALDAAGNIYTLGGFQGAADFDPGNGVFNLSSKGMTDIFISKIDASGNFVWAKSFGGKLQDDASSITINAYGNIFITGSFQDTVDFDPGSGIYKLISAGVQDVFISNLDSSGNFIWAKSMGGSSTDVSFCIALDPKGNIYTTGIFNNTCDFDPGPTVLNLTASGNKDIFVSALDSSGNFIWAKSMGGIGTDYGYSIKADALSNVYMTGFFQGVANFNTGTNPINLTSAGLNDIFIAKLDGTGKLKWVKSMGGADNDEGNCLALDSSGHIYITGDFHETVDFDPNAGTKKLLSSGAYDAFIAKFDTAGNLIWAKNVGGAYNDHGVGITFDQAGNSYTIGTFQSAANFDIGPNNYLLQSAGSNDIYILKLDASGNFFWVKVMGGTDNDFGRSIILDEKGSAYYSGYYNGSADFDPSGFNYYLTSKGLSDVFILKMSSCQPAYASIKLSICSGDAINNQTYRSSGIYLQRLTNNLGCDSILTLELTVNSVSDSVIRKGDTLIALADSCTYQWVKCSTLQPVNGEVNKEFIPISNGNYAVLITKNGCTITSKCFSVPASGLPGNESEDKIKIFPNPNTGKFNLEFPYPIRNTRIEIYSVLGDLIYAQSITEKSMNIDLQNVVSGLYFVKIFDSEKQVTVLKFLKN